MPHLLYLLSRHKHTASFYNGNTQSFSLTFSLVSLAVPIRCPNSSRFPVEVAVRLSPILYCLSKYAVFLFASTP